MRRSMSSSKTFTDFLGLDSSVALIITSISRNLIGNCYYMHQWKCWYLNTQALAYLGKSRGIQRTRELAAKHASIAAATIDSLPETGDEEVRKSRRALIDLTHRVITRNKWQYNFHFPTLLKIFAFFFFFKVSIIILAAWGSISSLVFHLYLSVIT